ncbi:MAG: hypothetical protein ACQESR_01225 [Planctomycetota bacterium]
MERCPTQAVRPLVGLAADKVIRDRYTSVETLARGVTMVNEETKSEFWRIPESEEARSTNAITKDKRTTRTSRNHTGLGHAGVRGQGSGIREIRVAHATDEAVEHFPRRNPIPAGLGVSDIRMTLAI